jgi:hypothetical protein
MTAAQTLVALLRDHIDTNHHDAERIIATLDEHELRILARQTTYLLADAIRAIEQYDRHRIDEHLHGLGIIAAQQLEAL